MAASVIHPQPQCTRQIRDSATHRSLPRESEVFSKKCMVHPCAPPQAQIAEPHTLRILKPSDGAKGERIQIMDDITAMTEFIDALPEGSIAYVASEYIERPFLLPGRRKFDWRLWVLLSHDFNIYLYREGVLRTCSVEYSLDDLSDQFAHLSNHCIQVTSESYGQFEVRLIFKGSSTRL